MGASRGGSKGRNKQDVEAPESDTEELGVYRQPIGVVAPMAVAPNVLQMWDGRRDSWGQQSHPAFEAERKRQILWMDVSVIL